MHYDRRVIAYHGTSRENFDRLMAGETFAVSKNEHDWLGEGTYFWENGIDRAQRWAYDRHGEAGQVIGALLQLGNCYDLMDTRYTEDLARGAEEFHRMPFPGGKYPQNHGKARRLDCAVLNWWLARLEGEGATFDTVRYGFEEGDPVHDGMAIRRESHIQIAVRNPSAIIGVFRPRAPA